MSSLFWIDRESDLVETADPLALQGVTDRFAEELLPGLSVVTYRARYYSFFCWARGIGAYSPKRIHKLETKLAYREVDFHDQDLCSFHGKRGAVKSGRRSSSILSTSSWNRGYRQSCIAMGLIESEAPYRLTETGRNLAALYGKETRNFKVAGKSALCALSWAENKELRKILGYDFRVPKSDQTNSNAGRMRRVGTSKAITRRCGWRVDSSFDVLNAFAKRSGKSEQEALLHQAAGWSYVCLGLSAIFYAYLRAKIRGGMAEKRMRSALRRARRSRRPEPLSERDAEDDRCLSIALADLARGSDILRHPVGGSSLIDTDGVLDIVNAFKSPSDREQGMEQLFQRHHERRPEDPWLSDNNTTVVVAEDRLPRFVVLSSMRLRIWMALRNDLYGT